MQASSPEKILFDEGSAHYRNGEEQLAAVIFRKVVEHHPDTSEAYRCRELLAAIGEVEGRRSQAAEKKATLHVQQGEMWLCGHCGEQVDGDYECCWNCQANRGESAQSETSGKNNGIPQATRVAPRRRTHPPAEQMEKRYRDAYRVARATILAAGMVKFIGIVLAVLGAIAALAIAKQSGPAAVAIGVLGVSTGVLIFGVGILISAQGQQLLTAVDDVINSSPFLTDIERADIMRLDMGEIEQV